MGSSSSKNDGNKALLLCKERMRYIKQAADLRYALSAAQLSYIRSLSVVGSAFRQYAKADILLDPEHSVSELEMTPARSSYASPSPSHIPELLAGSSSHNGSPFSPRKSNVSYMKVAGSSSVNVTVDSSTNHFVEEEDALTFPMPPPPPFLEISSSWDFFDSVEAVNSIKIPNCEKDMKQHFDKFASLRQNGPTAESMSSSQGIVSNSTYQASLPGISARRKMMDHSCSLSNYSFERYPESAQIKVTDVKSVQIESSVDIGSCEATLKTVSPELSRSKKAEVDRIDLERPDASKLSTHNPKDFLSSLKDIEQWFTRASESGHEVSRMLETKKIRLSIDSDIIGKSSNSFLSVLHPSCCKAGNVSEQDAIHHVKKVIIWNRSVSSRSSSSRNPLTSASKVDAAESDINFDEEFCMISGSHSSTLDRLYAWERKLYDELKASERIRKAYDHKRTQLRHQFAKDMNARFIDKTRAMVKDLHSQVRVAIEAVDSISRRIEKIRDEELQPQLAELIQGLIRMWKAMHESHQAQHIVISSAYHPKVSMMTSQSSDSYKQALVNLRNEMECFRSSYASWVGTQKSYIEALNCWLQKCILQPQERSRGRKVPFSPRRALAPPIFVLCHDWLAGLQTLPSEEVSESAKGVIMAISDLLEQQKEEKQVEKIEEAENGEEKNENEEEDERSEACFTGLSRLQATMIRSFELLVKFSEESVKIYENVKQESQIGRDAYISVGHADSVTSAPDGSFFSTLMTPTATVCLTSPDNEPSERWVLRERLHHHGLRWNHLHKPCISIVQKLWFFSSSLPDLTSY